MSGLVRGFIGLIEDGINIFARREAGDKFTGEIPSPEFFTAVRHGNKSAVNSLHELGYKHVWNWGGPLGRKAAEREIYGKAGRSSLQKVLPRGILTGSPIYGVDRALANLTGTGLKLGLKIGGIATLIDAAAAPKGKLVSHIGKGVGETAGGILGAAAGAALGGFVGEVVGGYAGAELGGLAGKLIENVQETGRHIHHLNVGGGYRDTEQAYTMRQRASMEIGRSLLNARQYLGKEACLMHQ